MEMIENARYVINRKNPKQCNPRTPVSTAVFSTVAVSTDDIGLSIFVEPVESLNRLA